MIKLYQFPISHFCEKVRWALEIKEVAYQTVNLLPGLHASQAKKMTGRSSLPILEQEAQYTQGSAEIITYLDQHYPQRPLTPKDDSHRKLALALEGFADREIGPATRVLCYHTLLDHPKLVVPMFTQNGPWYGSLMMKAAYPKMAVKMRQLMKINQQTADQALATISKALDKVNQQRGDREFLVANTFTRADLAVVALLSPLFMPDKYGVSWPDTAPQPLQGQIAGLREKLRWAEHIYEDFR